MSICWLFVSREYQHGCCFLLDNEDEGSDRLVICCRWKRKTKTKQELVVGCPGNKTDSSYEHKMQDKNVGVVDKERLKK